MKNYKELWQKHPTYSLTDTSKDAHLYLLVATKNNKPLGFYIGHTTMKAIGSPYDDEFETTLQGYKGSGVSLKELYDDTSVSVVKFILQSGDKDEIDFLEDIVLAQVLFEPFCLNQTFSSIKATTGLLRGYSLSKEATELLGNTTKKFHNHKPDRAVFKDKNKKLRETPWLRQEVLSVLVLEKAGRA